MKKFDRDTARFMIILGVVSGLLWLAVILDVASGSGSVQSTLLGSLLGLLAVGSVLWADKSYARKEDQEKRQGIGWVVGMGIVSAAVPLTSGLPGNWHVGFLAALAMFLGGGLILALVSPRKGETTE